MLKWQMYCVFSVKMPLQNSSLFCKQKPINITCILIKKKSVLAGFLDVTNWFMEPSLRVYTYICTKISLPQEYAFNPESGKLIKLFSFTFFCQIHQDFCMKAWTPQTAALNIFYMVFFVSVSTENSCYRSISLLIAFVLLTSAPSFFLQAGLYFIFCCYKLIQNLQVTWRFRIPFENGKTSLEYLRPHKQTHCSEMFGQEQMRIPSPAVTEIFISHIQKCNSSPHILVFLFDYLIP